ncbi:malate synthase A, partial [Kaistia algarum]
ATAEISRTQIWQQLHFEATLEGGEQVTKALFAKLLAEEMEVVKGEIGADNYAAGRFPEAIDLFARLSTADECEAFLTVPAYNLID